MSSTCTVAEAFHYVTQMEREKEWQCGHGVTMLKQSHTSPTHFRLYLAALHFNENSGLIQVRTAAGEWQFQMKFPKAKRGKHVESMVKTRYTTG